MSLLTLAQLKEAYLTRAVHDYLQSLDSTAIDNGDVGREGAYIVEEILDAIELHTTSLDALHEAATTMNASDWECREQRLMQGLRELLAAGKEVLSRSRGDLAGAQRLQERIAQVEYETFWSVEDYANTPKFEAMVEESERAYTAGEWEEGGWNK